METLLHGRRCRRCYVSLFYDLAFCGGGGPFIVTHVCVCVLSQGRLFRFSGFWKCQNFSPTFMPPLRYFSPPEKPLKLNLVSFLLTRNPHFGCWPPPPRPSTLKPSIGLFFIPLCPPLDNDVSGIVVHIITATRLARVCGTSEVRNEILAVIKDFLSSTFNLAVRSHPRTSST